MYVLQKSKEDGKHQTMSEEQMNQIKAIAMEENLDYKDLLSEAKALPESYKKQDEQLLVEDKAKLYDDEKFNLTSASEDISKLLENYR